MGKVGSMTNLDRVNNLKSLTMDDLLDLEGEMWEANEDIKAGLMIVRDEIMDRVREMKKKGLYIDSEVWERVRNFRGLTRS